MWKVRVTSEDQIQYHTMSTLEFKKQLKGKNNIYLIADCSAAKIGPSCTFFNSLTNTRTSGAVKVLSPGVQQ